MKKCFFMRQWNIYWKKQVKSKFHPKVDKERITIGSFLANGFGLIICVGGVCVCSKIVREMLATTFYIWACFHEMLMIWGSE